MGRKKSHYTSENTRSAKSKLHAKSSESIILLSESQAAYTSLQRDLVIQLIGLPVKGRLLNSNDETFFIEVIRKGLPKKTIDRLMMKIGLTEDEMAAILHISKRTIQRRDSNDLLKQEQSERLIELAKLYSRGMEVFGDIETFKDWMNRRVLTIGNKKPKEFLDTSIGISMLFDELGRIQHGVYS